MENYPSRLKIKLHLKSKALLVRQNIIIINIENR